MHNIIDLYFLIEMFFKLIGYVPITLGLAITSMIFASLLGFCVMIIRIKKIFILSTLADAYVLLGRALPTMVILYIVFFAVPIFMMFFSETTGKNINFNQVPAIVFAIIGLAICTSAYLAEAFRAAVQSIDKGQMEAAYSVGMTWWQGFYRVVFRQAAVFAMPLMANQFLNLIKSTSIAFMITVMELFGAANVICSDNNRYLEVYIVVAFIYWAISLFFENLFLVAENKLAFFKDGAN